MALLIIFAMALQCLSGGLVPREAQAADTYSWNGWEYEVDGSVAVITGYSGEETDLVFPQRVPSQEDDSSSMIPAVEIKEGAFEDNTEITSIRIPDGYTVMGGEAFSGCTSLQKVELPTTITQWPPHSKYDNNVMQTVTYQYAFSSCTSLTTVVIPEGVTALGMQMFAYCDALEEVELPSTLTNWDWAFYRAVGLKRVKMKEGLKKIPRSAFGLCPSLEEVEIPDTVTMIDYYAFDITALQNLTLPRDLTECYTNIEKGHRPGSSFNSSDWVYKETLGTLEIHSLTYVPTFSMDKWQKIIVPRYSQSEIQLANLSGLECFPGPDVSDVDIVPYQQEYDGQAHPAVTVTGLQEGDRVSYGTTSHGTFTEDVPELTEPESRKIWVRIEREGYYSPYQTQVTATVEDSRPTVIRELQKEMNKFDTLSANKEKYTVESWGSYEAAAGEAKTILEKDTSLFSELSDALADLQDARQNLVLSTGQPVSPLPGATDAPAPGSTGSPLPGATDSPIPGTTDAPVPGSTGQPLPGTTDVPLPGSTDQPLPGNTDEPAPGSTNHPLPGTTTVPSPGSSVRPSVTQTPGISNPGSGKKVSVAKAVISKVKRSGKKVITIRWKKVSGAQGYQITLGTNRKMTKNKKVVTVKGAAAVSKKVKKLKSGKTYYVKVRGWCTRNGKKVYGAWSSSKKIKL